jgi:ADP-ribose pyrophosphatase
MAAGIDMPPDETAGCGRCQTSDDDTCENPGMTETSEPIAEGHHLELRTRNGWEFAVRRRCQGVVAIVALTTDRRLVLVEQHRIPVGGRVIELPAGLVGDEPGRANESIIDAARRELLEETGYVSDHWSTESIRVTSSAGLTDEVVTIVGAGHARRLAPGGGVGDERINAHVVPIDTLATWLDRRAAEGVIADGRVWAARFLADRLGMD